MCIRRETREKARRSLAFSRVSKPHTHITHMLRQCTSIVIYLLDNAGMLIPIKTNGQNKKNKRTNTVLQALHTGPLWP